MQLNDAGQVELKLKTPWRDGTTHLVMSPLEFMQRLIRLHSALAPNAKLLKRVFDIDRQHARTAAAGNSRSSRPFASGR